jgi:hypothetical protein
MRCLTDKEVSEWLLEHSVPEDPYRGESSPAYYVQFYAPSAHRHLDAFVRNYHSLIIPDSESMIHMTDWGLYQPSQMIAIMGIRSSSDENRRLIHAPGHLLAPEEAETGVALFSLSASFAWSSYLYCPKQRSTLYNWEGDIFDFWTDCDATMEEMRLLLARSELAETTQGELDEDGKASPAIS